MKKADSCEKQIAELTSDLQRTRADFENYRKQVDLQKQQYGAIERIKTVSKFLPLLDDVERAIGAHSELAPLSKSLDKIIGELGLMKIDSNVGVDFNPDLHEAISVAGDGEREVISETLRTGYTYGDEVIRPTMVRVEKK